MRIVGHQHSHQIARSQKEILTKHQIHATNPRSRHNHITTSQAREESEPEPGEIRAGKREKKRGKRKKEGEKERDQSKLGIFTHHERVNEEVVVLEGIESGGRVDAILVVLAELEGRDDGAESPEHHVVEDLHSLRDCDSD